MSKSIPSFSEIITQSTNPISFSGLKVNQIKTELTNQLTEKEKLLQRLGTSPLSRNALINQTDMIRKELLNLNQYEEQELPDEIRSKLEDLANEFQYLKNVANSRDASFLPNNYLSSTPLLPPAPTNNLSPSKQRTKLMNGNRRNPDIEFATEIGQGLLFEVRKLQNILQDKDEIIKQLELSQADSERASEIVQRQLKQKEENDEKLKDENWNLEVMNQELQSNLLEANQTISRYNIELGRLTKQLKNQSEQLDIMKAQEEKSASMMEAMKARHEQETYQLRRHAATAQREQAQLKKQVETLNTELKICKAKLAIKLATSYRSDDGDIHRIDPIPSQDQELLSEGSDSNQIASLSSGAVVCSAPSSVNGSRNQAMEVETLKQSLAHAHRIISNLRSSYHKEKLEKFEFKKLLSENQETIEQMRKELANQTSLLGLNNSRALVKSNFNKRKPISPKKKRGGIARQPRGLCHNELFDTEKQQRQQQKQQRQQQQQQQQQLLEDSYTEEEEEDNTSTDEDNFLDPEFSNHTLGFENMMSFSSITMKPLSSELEANKVQMIDIGINTEPLEWFDLNNVIHISENHSTSSMGDEEALDMDTSSTNNTYSESYLMAQENIHDSSPISKEVVSNLLTRDVHSHHQNGSLIKLPFGHADSISISKMPSTVEEYTRIIQKHISRALIKERELMTERATTLLSPEQMRILFPSTSEEDASDLQDSFALGSDHDNDLEKLIQKAIFEKVMKMIPRTGMDALIRSVRQQMRGGNEGEELITSVVKDVHLDVHVTPSQDILTTDSPVPPDQVINGFEITQKNQMRDENESLNQLTLDKTSEVYNLLEKQRREFESAKKQEIKELEATHLMNLEEQRKDMEDIKKTELNKFMREMESLKASALENEKKQYEASKHAELEKQRLEMQAILTLELEKQRDEFEIAKSVECENQKSELELTKQIEIEALSKLIDILKKELEDTNQRMKTMLTKESVDVLIKRAVDEALLISERNQAKTLAGMISREYANIMVKDEVEKALEKERKEVAKREELEAIDMISKVESEALAKVAAADAIVKERQATVAREKDLMTKEEVDFMVQTASREAAKKEKVKLSLILDKERKMFREKEEKMIPKEEAERAIQDALLKYQQNNITMSRRNEYDHHHQIPYLETSIPIANYSTTQQTSRLEPTTTIKRSISTSRLASSSIDPSPSPSVSSPANSNHQLKLSRSVSSFKLMSRKKENHHTQKGKTIQQSLESGNNTINSFGTFSLLGTSKYKPSHRLHSRSTMSLRDMTNKQNSSVSISTLSSNDDHYSNNQYERMHISESFPSFSNTEGGTNMEIISAVTQTMIGEWMLKNTRRYVGGGISENKHQRFFWVHPYTKILYWSSAKPGAEGTQARTKSVFIESVSSVPSHDYSGISTKSLLIKTPKRELKITASTLERHELWLKSLTYLLGRPNIANQQIVEEPRQSTDNYNTENTSHQQATTILSAHSSEKSIPQVGDITQYDSDDSEDIANIRQCCNGKHDLSTLSRENFHHNHSH